MELGLWGGEHFSREHGSTGVQFTQACGFKRKQKPFFPIPELPRMPLCHRFEPLKGYLMEMKSQFKETVTDERLESCIRFSGRLWALSLGVWPNYQACAT